VEDGDKATAVGLAAFFSSLLGLYDKTKKFLALFC